MKVPCTLTLDPDTIAALDRRAEAEGRTRSGLARRMLAAGLVGTNDDFPHSAVRDSRPDHPPAAARRSPATARAGGNPFPSRG